MDLGHSRHSHQSNKVGPNDYVHLQKSSKSSNNSHRYFNQKPNSVSALNYNNNQPQQGHIFTTNQPQYHLANPNVIILPPPHTVMNGNVGHTSQYPPYNNERIVMISPPPSFRFMNPPSNAVYQQTIHQNQPINLPPPSFLSFRNSHVSNQAF